MTTTAREPARARAVRLGTPPVAPDVTAALNERRPDATGDLEATLPAVAANLANIAQGMPGMEAVQAGTRALIRRQPYREALSDIRTATGGIPAPIRVAERIAGALPLAPFLPSGIVQAGAAIGAADQALAADPVSIGGRAAQTAVGAGIGAAGGKLLQGIGNLAQRTGVTDALSRGLRRLGGRAADVGEAIGTRGAAAEVAGERQALLGQLGADERPAAQQMLDHVETYKAQASRLYDAARADTKAVTDPRVTQHLQDPVVQQALSIARQALGSAPVGAAPAVLPSGTATVGHAIALPTPEEVSLATRMLDAVVRRKFTAPTGIDPTEAARMAPKVAELRAALHDASPAWKEADSFYAQAKNFETAFQKAFGVAKKSTAGALVPSKLKTPEALATWVAKAEGTPVGAARAAGVEAGATARLSEALRDAPLGVDLSETLRGAGGAFEGTAAAAAARRLAFPGAGEAAAFEQRLTAAERGAATLRRPSLPVTLLKPWRALMRSDALTTPAGVALRRELAVNPDATAALLARAGRGRVTIKSLARLLTAGAAGAAAGATERRRP